MNLSIPYIDWKNMKAFQKIVLIFFVLLFILGWIMSPVSIALRDKRIVIIGLWFVVWGSFMSGLCVMLLNLERIRRGEKNMDKIFALANVIASNASSKEILPRYVFLSVVFYWEKEEGDLIKCLEIVDRIYAEISKIIEQLDGSKGYDPDIKTSKESENNLQRAYGIAKRKGETADLSHLFLAMIKVESEAQDILKRFEIDDALIKAWKKK